MTYDIKAIKKNAEHLGNAYFDDEDKLLLIDHSTLLKHNQYEVIKYEDIMYCYVDESDGVQASNHSLGYATLGAMVFRCNSWCCCRQTAAEGYYWNTGSSNDD